MSPPSMKQRLQALVGEMVERGIRLDEAADQFERQFLVEVLENHDGNQTRAAEAMRMHRNTLRRKLDRHGLL